MMKTVKKLLTALAAALIVTLPTVSLADTKLHIGSKWSLTGTTTVHSEYYPGGYVYVSRSDNNSVYSIVIDGDINSSLENVLVEMIPELKAANAAAGSNKALIVYLNSPGGYLSSGIRIGELFRANYVQTMVSGDQQCASACAIAWLGGYHRGVTSEGKLVFHAPYIKGKYGTAHCKSREEHPELETYIKKMTSSLEVDDYYKEYLIKAAFKCNPNGGITYTKGTNIGTF